MFSTCFNECSACLGVGISFSSVIHFFFFTLFQYEMLPLPLAWGNYFCHFGGSGRGGGNSASLFVGKALPTGLNILAIMGSGMVQGQVVP